MNLGRSWAAGKGLSTWAVVMVGVKSLLVYPWLMQGAQVQSRMCRRKVSFHVWEPRLPVTVGKSLPLTHLRLLACKVGIGTSVPQEILSVKPSQSGMPGC